MEIGRAPWRAWGTSLTAPVTDEWHKVGEGLRGNRPSSKAGLLHWEQVFIHCNDFQAVWTPRALPLTKPWGPDRDQEYASTWYSFSDLGQVLAHKPLLSGATVQFYLFASFSWKCCPLTVLLKCTSPGKLKLWTVLDNAEHISFSWQRQVKRFLGYDAKCCDMTLVSLWPRSGQGCDVNDTPSPTHGLWWLEADAGTSPPPRVPSHLSLWGWQQVGIADKWLISSPIKWLQSSFLWSPTDYILHPPLFWQLHSSSALC